jgi:hypothetical protein
MADITPDASSWSSTPGSNSPSGSTTIGTGLDDNLRAIQAGVKAQIEELSSVAGTNTITAACTGLTAYVAGQRFPFKPANTNTGATTLNITGTSALGAKNVFWNGAACVGGELRANIPAMVEYDGTQFHIIANGFNAPYLDTHPVVQGSADSTKKVRIEADGLSTATTRTWTASDADITVAGVNVAQTWTALQAFNSGITANGGIAVNAAVAITQGVAADADPAAHNVVGFAVLTSSILSVCATGTVAAAFNRKTDDGAIINLNQDGSTEGTISVSGTTVSYNAFLGSHWSQFSGKGRVELLKGTVMESIDELCDWDGEENDRLPKCKVSDKEGSKAVYGVFLAWDEDEFRMIQATRDATVERTTIECVDGVWRKTIVPIDQVQPLYTAYPVFEADGKTPVMVKVTEATKDQPAVFEQAKHLEPVMVQREGSNDLYVAAIGAGWVRIQKGQVVTIGDLLESAGDGTARVQADDAIRASTIAKVNSATSVTTYADGSFLVPCTLLCG